MACAVNFHDMRAALRVIGETVGEGYLVSCSWDGSLMRVAVGRVAGEDMEWRKPWVMTFDSDADYSTDPAKLVDDLAHGARVLFGSPKEQADEIERLLNQVKAKTMES